MDDKSVRGTMGVWQGVVMDSLKLGPGLPCPTFLYHAGGSLLKRPYGRFRGSPPAGWPACALLVPLWTPHVVRLPSWKQKCSYLNCCFLAKLFIEIEIFRIYAKK
jgi:hypothetical protein